MQKLTSINAVKVLFFLLLAILIAFTAGCDKRNPDAYNVRVTDLFCNGENPTIVNDGVTTVELSAYVKDRDDFAVEGQTVRFKASDSNVIFNKAFAESDSSGIARTIVTYTRGAMVETEKVTISASIGTKVQKEIDIAVMHRDSIRVESIEFLTTVPPNIQVLGQLQIRVKPMPEEGYIIPDGIGVTFHSSNNMGSFYAINNPTDERQQITVLLNDQGEATVGWKSGTIARPTRIYASIANHEDFRAIEVRPGPARNIMMDLPQTTIKANASGFVIPTYLFDAFDNSIPQRKIDFETTLGSVIPEATTNDEGVAEPQFTPGATTGVANITATCGDSASATVSITIMSEGVAYLKWENDDIIHLNVQGYGVSTAPLGVEALDSSGNRYLPTVTIKFTIVDSPEGVTIGGSSNFVNVETSIGVATPTINAGTKSGPVRFRAELLKPDGTLDERVAPIEDGKAIVAAGPPYFMNLLNPNYNQAEAHSAGIFVTPIGALLQDVYRNPITKGTAVFFSIPDVYEGWTPQDTVALSISPWSYVGNVSMFGDSLDGVAYTELTYHGSISNLRVPIRVDVGGGFYIIDWTKLPMNEIQIEVVLDPGYVRWNTENYTVPADREHPSMLKWTMLKVFVRDGAENPMKDAIINFWADDGFFFDQHSPNYNPNLHGPHNGFPSSGGYPPIAPSLGLPEDPTDENWMVDPINGKIDTPGMAVTGQDGKLNKKWYSYRYLNAGMESPAVDQVSVTISVEGTQVGTTVQFRIDWYFDL
ncbi:MAG: hypothetical protein FWG20_02465 [Candidatus Cloacimonetes bacterium]|nr:hypothetical protein [Candidatus Cloacimonadota bacterium]